MITHAHIAILGATGAVGQEFIELIEERDVPYSRLTLLASARSAGKKITVKGVEYTVQEACPEAFDDVDIALFAGGSISQTLAPQAAARGAVVIDNSSTFRMDPDVPLIVPEINPQDIMSHQGIIANPNCSTIIMLMALKPIHDISPIRRIVVSTYQAVSGAGKEGMAELETQLRDFSVGKPLQAEVLPVSSLATHYPIANNLIPQIDIFLENDYSKEEMKMVHETHKVFHDDTIAITPTTVRVPVMRSHSMAVYIETREQVPVAQVRKALEAAEGITVVDDLAQMKYPMPLYTSRQNDVQVGRIRADLSVPNGINLWVVGDQIRKGAALNTLQIAEYILAHDLLKGRG